MHYMHNGLLGSCYYMHDFVKNSLIRAPGALIVAKSLENGGVRTDEEP
jgi:hypothetical protein